MQCFPDILDIVERIDLPEIREVVQGFQNQGQIFLELLESFSSVMKGHQAPGVGLQCPSGRLLITIAAAGEAVERLMSLLVGHNDSGIEDKAKLIVDPLFFKDVRQVILDKTKNKEQINKNMISGSV
jgi:hypothetical protein